MPPKPFQTGGGWIGTGAGFFFAFLRAGAPRFAVLDFFAKFNPRRFDKKYANTAPHRNDDHV
jgi:hypothetical protein